MRIAIDRLLVGSSVAATYILRWLFHIVLILLLIPSGSVDPVSLHITATGMFVIAVFSTVFGGQNNSVRYLYLATLVIAALLACWIILQASAINGSAFVNPIWKEAAKIYGPMAQSISVSPGDTMQGLIAALLPFAVFMITLLIFQNDTLAFNLIRVITITGLLLCAITLVQFTFFPNMLMFDAKHFYLDSMTAFFVNRNTAATYLAMILICSCGLTFHYLQNAGLRSFLRFLVDAPSKTSGSDAMLTVLFGAGAAIALIALMLTRSRAGITSGMTGLTVMMAILAYTGGQPAAQNATRGFAKRVTPIRVRLGRVGIVLAAVIVTVLVLAAQAITRAGAQGTRDLRFCFFPSLIDMTKENWVVGTGFGTFRDVFPAYRNPSCGMDGVLDLAHNFYLEGWISLGFPFVILAAIIVVALVYTMIIGIRERRQYRWAPAAGLAILILQVMHNGVDFSIQNPGVAAVFACLTGATAIIACGRGSKKRARSNKTVPIENSMRP